MFSYPKELKFVSTTLTVYIIQEKTGPVKNRFYQFSPNYGLKRIVVAKALFLDLIKDQGSTIFGYKYKLTSSAVNFG